MYEKILEGEKGLLTVEKLAALLSVSERHVYQLAQCGKLPHLKIGGAIRFDPQVVIEWLNLAESGDIGGGGMMKAPSVQKKLRRAVRDHDPSQ